MKTDACYKEVKEMANVKSAKKRALQAEFRHAQNASQKSDLRTHIKKYESLIEQKDAEGAQVALRLVIKRLGKASSKGIIQKNEAKRRTSSLTKKLNALQA